MPSRSPSTATPAGTYTVAYRVVSDDGHTITGSFVFHVGERTGAATIDQSIPTSTSAVGGIGRWLGYAGAAVAVGAALLLALLRRGGDTADRPPGAALGRLGSLVVGGAAASALGTSRGRAGPDGHDDGPLARRRPVPRRRGRR